LASTSVGVLVTAGGVSNIKNADISVDSNNCRDVNNRRDANNSRDEGNSMKCWKQQLTEGM